MKPQSPSRKRQAVEALIAVLALSLVLLPACGPHVGKQTVRIKYYQNCYQPLLDLRAAQDKIKSDTAKGAAAGAVAGAMTGLMVRGDLKGALVGAVIGAAVGGIGTYLVSSSIQNKALAERLQAYNGAFDQALAELNLASRSAQTTCDCYRKEYNNLKKAYQRNKSMSKAEMLERIQEMRDGTNDAVEILAHYKNLSSENLKTFNEVVRHEETRSSDRAPTKTLNTVKKKRNDYQKTSDSVNNQIKTAQNNISLYENEFNMIRDQAELDRQNRLAEIKAGEEAKL